MTKKVAELVRGWVDRGLPTRAPVTPDYVQVEIVNRCNLRCVMCAISELTAARKRKVLDVDGFAAIVGQFPAVRRVDLQGIGEPLLNPHLESIIGWCRDRGIEVGFVTNGLLFDGERAERVILAGPSHVVFSVDSVDAEVFARVRPGADVGKVLCNIRGLLQARNRLGKHSPHVGIMAVAMKDSIDGLHAVVEEAAALEVDGLTIKGVNTRPNPEVATTGAEPAMRRLHEAIERHPGLQVTVACENDRAQLRCRWPWTAAYVTAEGDLTPCCNCPDARDVTFGNLLETPFKKLWNNSPYRMFRRELRDGMPEICRNCPDY